MDKLTEFKDKYLSSLDLTIAIPFDNPIQFDDGISSISIYRDKEFQVEFIICQPNLTIPEHFHPNVDSYEVFLYGMSFTHSGEIIVSEKMALAEDHKGMPFHYKETIRVKPTDWHGGKSSKKGGAFLSIQRWLNNVKPTHVGADWVGESMGKKHNKAIKEQEWLMKERKN